MTKRKYKLNDSFFENIDSEKKAYVLGFVYADGNNKTQGSGLMFTINAEDVEILEKIKDALCSDAKISIIESHGYCEGKCAHIDFNSHKISMDLSEKGAPPNKTYKIVFPKFLRDDLIPHFIRGYFDGDGCIWNGKRKKMCVRDPLSKNGYKNRIVHNVKFTITSNSNFIIDMQETLIEKLGLKKTKLYFRNKDNKSIATLEYSGRGNIKKFFEYIYKDATIFLERKFKKFNEIICALDEKPSSETGLIAGNPLES